MVSTFTSNLGLEEPANGDYPGTWGSAAVNPNMVIIDTAFGGTVSIDLSAGSVTLSTAQVRQASLIFNGNLPGNVTVTIPAIGSGPLAGRNMSLLNNCGNSSLYSIVFMSTVAASKSIGLPPQEVVDVFVNGNTGGIRYRNLGHIGSEWQHAGSSVPNWVSACSVPPYLLADGSAFSSAVYSALANYLGGTTLPDARGRYRANLNTGTGRITTGASLGGIDGNTLFSSGGSQVVTLSSVNIPALTIQPHQHGIHGGTGALSNALGVLYPVPTAWSSAGATNFGVTDNSSVLTTDSSAGALTFSNLPPTYIGGITMICAGQS